MPLIVIFSFDREVIDVTVDIFGVAPQPELWGLAEYPKARPMNEDATSSASIVGMMRFFMSRKNARMRLYGFREKTGTNYIA